MHDPFVGTWTLNPARSQFDANHKPREGTLQWQLEPDGAYLMLAEGRNEKGDTCTERLTGPPSRNDPAIHPGAAPRCGCRRKRPDTRGRWCHVEGPKRDGRVLLDARIVGPKLPQGDDLLRPASVRTCETRALQAVAKRMVGLCGL